jgi:hypothetical protein
MIAFGLCAALLGLSSILVALAALRLELTEAVRDSLRDLRL